MHLITDVSHTMWFALEVAFIFRMAVVLDHLPLDNNFYHASMCIMAQYYFKFIRIIIIVRIANADTVALQVNSLPISKQSNDKSEVQAVRYWHGLIS